MFQLVVLTAVPFIWFGMVAAISFLETPLKFRAPGMTVALGVGIGRIVFKALNSIEALFAIVLVIAVLTNPSAAPLTARAALGVAVATLAVQVLVLRPSMAKRTRPLAQSAAITANPGDSGGSSSSPTNVTVAAQDPDPAAPAASLAAAVITETPPVPIAKKATAAHLSYVAVELIKFVALPIAGIAVLLAAL